MNDKKRIRDYGIQIGQLPTGNQNTISDVEGVTVGHVTLSQGSIQTGVTAIFPHQGNCFEEKVFAASHVINGFGKTAGTIQMDELGTLETPILLTNTLSVGTSSEALVEYMLENNPSIGVTTGTVNPVVGECNDGYLNDIRGLHVKKDHVREAILAASDLVEEGAVGAGTGMSCYGLKGGIGTSSRLITIGQNTYTVGVLVLSNFGKMQDLMIKGIPAGQWIKEWESDGHEGQADRGSIIFIIATDIPLSERQLKRMTKRVTVGLARTGSYIGHGSGDIAIAFSTAQRIRHLEEQPVISLAMLQEDRMDDVFRAVAEAAEEAILNSMLSAESKTGRDGHHRQSLGFYMDRILKRAKEDCILSR